MLCYPATNLLGSLLLDLVFLQFIFQNKRAFADNNYFPRILSSLMFSKVNNCISFKTLGHFMIIF